jgi:hypothetical protein
MMITITIPSLERIKDMDRKGVEIHLRSAKIELRKLQFYIETMEKRIGTENESSVPVSIL